jgi:hypothetical protein
MLTDSLGAVDAIMKWWEHPASMVRDIFKVEPDAWQEKVLEAFPNNQRIAMKACKGPGKSTVDAWCAWNFLLTRPHPKIAATSITAENLADGLWTEMAKWKKASDLLDKKFEWTKTRIFNKEHPETWYMSARTWPKRSDATAQADTLAGLHADYMLFILDESGGIPEAVMTTAEAGLSVGIETKIVQSGNPTHLTGPLYNAVTRDRRLWWVAEITGDPDDPNRSPRIDIQWARDMIATHGRDNPWVLINVFGQFPPASLNVLLGPEEVREAMLRTLDPTDYQHAQKRMGIDVARYGDDSTVICRRQGLMCFPLIEIRSANTTEISGRAMYHKRETGSEIEMIDGTGGYGAGVFDAMLAAGGDPIEIHSGSNACDSGHYFNRRSEMWFEMAKWVKRGGCLPDDPSLVRELTTPTYTFDKKGRIQVEAKDIFKKRLGYSPDRADAVALTFSLPEISDGLTPGGLHIPGLQRKAQFAKHDWNPLSRR